MCFGEHNSASEKVTFQKFEKHHEVFVNQMSVNFLTLFISEEFLHEQHSVICLHKALVLFIRHFLFQTSRKDLNSLSVLLLLPDELIFEVALQRNRLWLNLIFGVFTGLFCADIKFLAAHLALPLNNHIESFGHLSFAQDVFT